MKQILSVIIGVVMIMTILAGSGMAEDGYFRENATEVPKPQPIGGSAELQLSVSENSITLENAHVRAVFSTKNGSVRELANKDANLYLTREGDAKPLRISLIRNGNETTVSKYDAFSYELVDGESKTIQFQWQLGGITVHADVTLTKEADELVFRVSYAGNNLVMTDEGIPIESLYHVEYPVINHIGQLYSAERDRLLTPFVTGYIIDDPLTAFNGTFSGIGRSLGMYPSGWGYPMQFQSYYAEGIGGFMMSTRDGGNGIKSFTCTGSDEGLRTSIYHFVDNLGQSDGCFDYDIVISNLCKGTWNESADRYREWALAQSWATEKGKRQDRDELNMYLYRDTALCNFIFPGTSAYGKENQEKLYSMEKENLKGGKMLNIGWMSSPDRLMSLARENDDLFMFFEFPSFHRVPTAMQNPDEWKTMVRTFRTDESSVYYNIGSTRYFYDCAACEEYRKTFYEHDETILKNSGTDGFYHDVGYAAVHPMQCFNTLHNHGTRVNVASEYLEQMKEICDLAHSTGGVYGQELIFEQMLPYIDFYQARANAELAGWMESDRIRILMTEGKCHKVSLFDYVYSGYGPMRIDGFLSPDPQLGSAFDWIAAYTFVNNGIPEFNYEFYNSQTYIQPEDADVNHLRFLGSMYEAKDLFAADYMLYGQMVRTPEFGATAVARPFVQTRYQQNRLYEGSMELDNIVACSYRLDETVATVMVNTTDQPVLLRFAVDTDSNWGIKQGTVSLITVEEEQTLGDFENGEARVSFEIQPYQTVMIAYDNK